MQSEKIEYKKSLKKQTTYFAIFFLGMIVFGLILYTLNTTEKTLAFFAGAVLMAAFTLFVVRKAAKEAACPHCKTDIYSVIEHARQSKIPFNFCPACGKNVKI